MAKFALEAVRGDTIPLQLTITRNNAAVNLTGAAFRLACKKWKNDTVPLILVETATVETPSSGVAVITILPEDTEDFEDTIILSCDIQLTESDGRKTTVASGSLKILADIA